MQKIESIENTVKLDIIDFDARRSTWLLTVMI